MDHLDISNTVGSTGAFMVTGVATTVFPSCSIIFLTFGAGVLHLIQINHQRNATVFQLIILTFVYSSTCFGRFPAHHQELNDCSGSLWFFLRIVVIVVLCSRSGRPAGRPDHESSKTVTTIRRKTRGMSLLSLSS
jgi:hypothetical protein